MTCFPTDQIECFFGKSNYTDGKRHYQLAYTPNFSQFPSTMTKTSWCKMWKLDWKLNNSLIKPSYLFYWQCFWVQNGSLESSFKYGIGLSWYFCTFFTNFLIFVFQSKHSSNLGWREYKVCTINQILIEYQVDMWLKYDQLSFGI
jgi:hypothetical protein